MAIPTAEDRRKNPWDLTSASSASSVVVPILPTQKGVSGMLRSIAGGALRFMLGPARDSPRCERPLRRGRAPAG